MQATIISPLYNWQILWNVLPHPFLVLLIHPQRAARVIFKKTWNLIILLYWLKLFTCFPLFFSERLEKIASLLRHHMVWLLIPPPLWIHQLFSLSRLITLLGFGLLWTYKAQCSFFPQDFQTSIHLSHLSLNVAFSVKISIVLHISLAVLVRHNHNTLYIAFISLVTTEMTEKLL